VNAEFTSPASVAAVLDAWPLNEATYLIHSHSLTFSFSPSYTQVNAEFTSPASVAAVLDAWPLNEATYLKKVPAVVAEASTGCKPPSFSSLYGSSTMSQTMTLLRRHGALVVRDPTLYTGRAIMFLFGNLFFAVMYIAARDREQDQVGSITLAFVFIICIYLSHVHRGARLGTGPGRFNRALSLNVNHYLSFVLQPNTLTHHSFLRSLPYLALPGSKQGVGAHVVRGRAVFLRCNQGADGVAGNAGHRKGGEKRHGATAVIP
jgi:hypothetical protein